MAISTSTAPSASSRVGARHPLRRLPPQTQVVLVTLSFLGRLAPATASEGPLNRDGKLTPAYPYGYSDGGDEYPDDDPGRWQLPGPFSLLEPDPELQTLVFGPTFRNEEDAKAAGEPDGERERKESPPTTVEGEPTSGPRGEGTDQPR